MLLLLIIFNIIAIFDLIQAYVITDILFYLLGSLNYSFIFGVLDLVFFTLFKYLKLLFCCRVNLYL